MNTSVSPLPIPIWPMLALSAVLVAVTSAAVTFSSQRATQVYPARTDMSLETEAPNIYFKSQARWQRAHARRPAL